MALAFEVTLRRGRPVVDDHEGVVAIDVHSHEWDGEALPAVGTGNRGRGHPKRRIRVGLHTPGHPGSQPQSCPVTPRQFAGVAGTIPPPHWGVRCYLTIQPAQTRAQTW